MGKTTFQKLTAFRIGGEIEDYREVSDKEELVEAVKFAKAKNLPVFVLGDGTDILVSDENFSGVVIKYAGENINLDGEILTAEAGVNWDDLCEYAVSHDLQGMECLSGIPGTTGAAPIQNIGAYGAELKDVFVTLTACDIANQKFVNFDNKACEFGYRESIFKKKSHWQKYVICDITLRLKKGRHPNANYESLASRLPENPTLRQVRDAVVKVREEKLENPKIIGNAGSFFKNPIIPASEKDRLEKEFPGIKIFPFGDLFKISAAWLIEETGWKGKVYKNAGVSPKHALILINRTGEAKASEIMELSEKIISDVQAKFSISLEREVQLINF